MTHFEKERDRERDRQTERETLTPAVILVVSETSLWTGLDAASGGQEEWRKTAHAKPRTVTLLTIVLTA